MMKWFQRYSARRYRDSSVLLWFGSAAVFGASPWLFSWVAAALAPFSKRCFSGELQGCYEIFSQQIFLFLFVPIGIFFVLFMIAILPCLLLEGKEPVHKERSPHHYSFLILPVLSFVGYLFIVIWMFVPFMEDVWRIPFDRGFFASNLYSRFVLGVMIIALLLCVCRGGELLLHALRDRRNRS